MFSKSEVDYLKGMKKVSKGYERYLRHSVNKKLIKFEEQILPIILDNESTRSWFINLVRKNTNSIRENSNVTQNQERTKTSLISEKGLINWWGSPDLNRSRERPRLEA